MKKSLLLLILFMLFLPGCGVMHEHFGQTSEPNVPIKTGTDFGARKDGWYSIKSYDVNGAPIEEKIQVTNIYRQLPPFLFTEKTPEEGTHFECVEYSLNHSPKEEFYYVNIYVKGYDGSRLSYKGITFPKRTYDYYDFMTPTFEKIYCFYAIPDGLDQYSLEFLNEIEKNSTKFTVFVEF